MTLSLISLSKISKLFKYLATHDPTSGQSFPPLVDISKELDISIGSLREQLEVARVFGFVEVKPRIGTRRLPYSFLPAVKQSLGYALILNNDYFQAYSSLRIHIESAYWYEAVMKLTSEDHQQLKHLIDQAWGKLRGTPVNIPHDEHRELHLLIYCRLNNPFVQGILEAYWDAYEDVGLNVYTGYDYLVEVWQYHSAMVEAICCGNYQNGYDALIRHTDLIYHRPLTET